MRIPRTVTIKIRSLLLSRSLDPRARHFDGISINAERGHGSAASLYREGQAKVTATMARNEPNSRISSATSASTESTASDITVKPLPALPRDKVDKDNAANASSRRRSSSRGSRRAAPPSKLKTGEHGHGHGHLFK